MNICCFIGRVVRDVELKESKGYSVAEFSLAINSGYGEKRQTTYIEMSAFGRIAETLAKYGKKGTKIAVQSYIRDNSYVSKTGQKIKAYKFVVQSFDFCESKANDTANTWDSPEMPESSAIGKPDTSGFMPQEEPLAADDDFMNIPDGFDNIQFPF